MAKKTKKSQMLCEVCLDVDIKTYMIPTGRVFMTDPMKKEYKCTECGYKTIISIDKIKV